MASFTVEGPFRVPTHAGRTGARRVDRKKLRKSGTRRAAGRRGLLCLRHPKPRQDPALRRPHYELVPKRVCFEQHKVNKYDAVLLDVIRGTPVMYFLGTRPRTGSPKRARDFRSRRAAHSARETAQSGLKNISGTREESITIRDVMGAGRSRGAPSKPARGFKKMLSIK